MVFMRPFQVLLRLRSHIISWLESRAHPGNRSAWEGLPKLERGTPPMIPQMFNTMTMFELIMPMESA